MISQSVAKIFLSEQRGINETEGFRSYNTFNFGNYHHEHKHPSGDLYVLNDDSLAGGRSLKMYVEESSYVILLPIVGFVSYLDSLGNESLVNAGEIQAFHNSADYNFELVNPYESELINFLQIWIRTSQQASTFKPVKPGFNIDKNKNSFALVSPIPDKSTGGPSTHPIIAIGKFTGRQDVVYQKNKKENSLFVFVIEGAFEIEGRLLHSRDGLSLSGEVDKIELEALSNDAIVLVVET